MNPSLIRCVLLSFVITLMTSQISYGEEMGTNISIGQQMIYKDNFLFSEKDSQDLTGIKLVPRIDIYRRSERTDISLGIQSSVEKYDQSVYNNHYESYDLGYQKRNEKYVWGIDFEQIKEPTHVSELQESGVFDIVPSDTLSKKLLSNIGYSISEKNFVSVKISEQQKRFDSDRYADFDNTNIQTSWNRKVSDTMDIYLGFSVTEYESEYQGRFQYLPVELLGIKFCPPATLIFQDRCLSPNLPEGQSGNISETQGGLVGFSWSPSRTLKVNVRLGGDNTKTRQEISLPKQIVSLGEPINQDIVFGGKQENKTSVSSQNTEWALIYSQERYSADLVWSRQIQPGSLGSLWKVDNIKLQTQFQLNELSQLSFGVSSADFKTLDKQTINTNENERRNLHVFVNYSYQLAPAWKMTANLQKTNQRIYVKPKIDIESWQGFIGFHYFPQKWVW
jgi:hypothetical protein